MHEEFEVRSVSFIDISTVPNHVSQKQTTQPKERRAEGPYLNQNRLKYTNTKGRSHGVNFLRPQFYPPPDTASLISAYLSECINHQFKQSRPDQQAPLPSIIQPQPVSSPNPAILHPLPCQLKVFHERQPQLPYHRRSPPHYTPPAPRSDDRSLEI